MLRINTTEPHPVVWGALSSHTRGWLHDLALSAPSSDSSLARGARVYWVHSLMLTESHHAVILLNSGDTVISWESTLSSLTPECEEATNHPQSSQLWRQTSGECEDPMDILLPQDQSQGRSCKYSFWLVGRQEVKQGETGVWREAWQ